MDPARAVCCPFLLQVEMDAAEALKCRGGPEDMGPDAGFPPLEVGDGGARAPKPRGDGRRGGRGGVSRVLRT